MRDARRFKPGAQSAPSSRLIPLSINGGSLDGQFHKFLKWSQARASVRSEIFRCLPTRCKKCHANQK
jgi:hypothetical protein